jgi:hypothetical protein
VYEVVGYARKGNVLPLVGRTVNNEYWLVSVGGSQAWLLASLAEASAGAEQAPVVRALPPTPTASPTASATPRPTPTSLPVPILVEPPWGAQFEDKVRFKFTWYRRLLPHEKFSIYVQSAHEGAEFDWWVSERDLLDGGGAIYAVPGGFLYEVNSGLGDIPNGEAVWRVAAFDDRPGVKRPVCGWSEGRGIVKR